MVSFLRLQAQTEYFVKGIPEHNKPEQKHTEFQHCSLQFNVKETIFSVSVFLIIICVTSIKSTLYPTWPPKRTIKTLFSVIMQKITDVFTFSATKLFQCTAYDYFCFLFNTLF